MATKGMTFYSMKGMKSGDEEDDFFLNSSTTCRPKAPKFSRESRIILDD